MVAESSELQHDVFHQKSDTARFMDSITAELAPRSKYRLRVIQSGSRASRVNISVSLHGEAASCELNGVTIADARQQLDLHSLIHHLAPGGTSKQQQKNIAAGGGECIFKGAIRVDKAAQQ